MIAYYDVLPVISTSQKFRTYYDYQGQQWISDFDIPYGFAFLGNAIDELQKQLQNHLGISHITMLPSEFNDKLTAHQNDPKNWPSQPDCDCCCHRSSGFGGSCCD